MIEGGSTASLTLVVYSGLCLLQTSIWAQHIMEAGVDIRIDVVVVDFISVWAVTRLKCIPIYIHNIQ